MATGYLNQVTCSTVCAVILGLFYASLAIGEPIPLPLLRPSLASSEAPLPWSLRVGEDWTRVGIRDSAWPNGLYVVDLDGDDVQEIILNAGGVLGEFWYVLSHSSEGYRREWFSSLPESVIGTANLDGAPGDEIVAAGGGVVLIYDGATRELLHRVSSSASWGAQIADPDADGELELLTCGGDYDAGFYVHDLLTGRQELHAAEYRCWGVAVGNVDEDPAPEIVLGGGISSEGEYPPGYVIDGVTHRLEWTYDPGVYVPAFGELVRLGDLDGDGREEIVAASFDSFVVTIYDADLRLPAWEIPVEGTVGALRVMDVEGDGYLDVVVGGTRSFGVDVWDSQTRTLKWSITSPEPAIMEIGLGDTDGDGVNELVWGAGQSQFESNYLVIASTATRQVEWQSPPGIAGPFRALDYGDVDHDGEPELLYGSSSRSGDGRYFIHDARTKALEYESDPGPAVWRLGHADVDGDPQAEIFIATENAVTCRDGITHAEQWRWYPPDFHDPRSLEVADIDSDGEIEVIVGSRSAVHVLDAVTGTEEWRSVTLGSSWEGLSLLRIADVDGDRHLEIVAAETGEQLFVHDGVTHVQELQTADLNITALETVDWEGSDAAEILIGTESGAVAVLDPVTGAVAETLCEHGETAEALVAVDFTGDLVPELVLSTERELRIYDGLFPSELLWASGVIRSGFSPQVGDSVDALRVADIDQDGKIEILVGLGELGVKIYQVEGFGPWSAEPPLGFWMTSPGLPGFRFKVRITAGDQVFAGTKEPDCIPETVCVSGALPGRSELFLRMIGPRPNGYMWTNLVRFTTSRVEVEIEQLATGETRTYVLEQVPRASDELPGSVDKEAFMP